MHDGSGRLNNIELYGIKCIIKLSTGCSIVDRISEHIPYHIYITPKNHLYLAWNVK